MDNVENEDGNGSIEEGLPPIKPIKIDSWHDPDLGRDLILVRTPEDRLDIWEESGDFQPIPSTLPDSVKLSTSLRRIQYLLSILQRM